MPGAAGTRRGARGAGVRPLGFDGGGGGPERWGQLAGRYHKPREKFFKNQKPIGSLLYIFHKSPNRDSITVTMEQATTSSVGTVVTGDSQLPNWLSCPDPKPPRPSKSARELLHLEYEQIFERVVEDIYRGRSLQSLIEDDHRVVSYEDFLRWIKRDPQRHERFKEAQEMRTEFMAGEILEIADGVEAVDPQSNDTVNRDKLRIDTRKWLMGAHNKKRYGETKQIELGGTISITEALAQAQARVIEAEVVDVTPRLENSDD